MRVSDQLVQRRRFIAAALVLLAVPGLAVAQTPAKSGNAAGFDYEMVVRGAPPETQHLPLLVAFHYSGGTLAQVFENYDAVSGPVRIIAVRGANPKRGGFSYFPVDYYQLSEEQQLPVARETVARIADFLRTVSKTYGAKPVVSGASQGGDISFRLAVDHPDLIQAALPIAPVMPASVQPASAAGRDARPPIYVFQGEADPIVNVETVRKRVDELKPVLPITLKTYPGLGHDISPEEKADYTAVINKLLRGR